MRTWRGWISGIPQKRFFNCFVICAIIFVPPTEFSFLTWWKNYFLYHIFDKFNIFQYAIPNWTPLMIHKHEIFPQMLIIFTPLSYLLKFYTRLRDLKITFRNNYNQIKAAYEKKWYCWKEKKNKPRGFS